MSTIFGKSEEDKFYEQQLGDHLDKFDNVELEYCQDCGSELDEDGKCERCEMELEF